MPPVPLRLHRCPSLWAPLTFAALVLVGCGADETTTAAPADTTSTTATPPAESTTSTTLSPEDEVVAALQEALDAYGEAAATSDPDHPRLVETTTGEELDNARSHLAQLRALDVVNVGSSVYDSGAVQIVGSTATIDACLTEGSADHDRRDEPPTDVPTGQFSYQIELVVDGDVWKLSKLEYVGPGCDD